MVYAMVRISEEKGTISLDLLRREDATPMEWAVAEAFERMVLEVLSKTQGFKLQEEVHDPEPPLRPRGA